MRGRGCKRFFCLLLILSLLGLGALTGCKEGGMNDEFTMTVFSDVHHGDHDYNDFACTNGLKKLRAILDETRDSDCYANLGDFVDYLKNGKNDFYDQAAAVAAEYGISFYDRTNAAADKVMYAMMGNHEAAFVPKSQLSDYIPYEQGVGSCYVFERGGVLFVAVDGNFERETGSDDPTLLRTTTKFVLPEGELNFLKQRVAASMHDGIKSIVWLSHVAFKDLENKSRWDLADALIAYGRPVTIFEGHTHVENYQEWYDDQDESIINLRIYTLPAVTSGAGYRYYNVTFRSGLVKSVEKHTDGTVALD